jgi:hypothetical protein
MSNQMGDIWTRQAERQARVDKGLPAEPKSDCAYCRAHAGDNMMPPHTPSIHCESGKHPHCTCDVCY